MIEDSLWLIQEGVNLRSLEEEEPDQEDKRVIDDILLVSISMLLLLCYDYQYKDI